MDNTENSKYEIMVILLPNLGEEGSKKELDEIRSLIAENNGEIYHEDIWGIRDFAYKMKKQEQGFYAVFNFTLEPEKVRKLEKPLRLNQKVIRYLIVKTPANYEIKTLEEYLKEAEIEEKQTRSAAERPKTEKPEAVKEGKGKTAIKKEEPKKEEPKKEEPKKEEPKKEEPKKEEPKKEEPKKEEPKKEEPKKEEPKEEPKEEKKPAVKLDDVDERLRSIIDDPDISL